MAVDIFIKIGSVQGEAKDQAHKNEIDVLHWSWSMHNSGGAHATGGQGSGKVNVSDLSFTKWVDKSSPDLMLACCNGKHFPEATLTVRKAGEHPLEYLVIKMKNLIVSSVTAGGSGSEDRLTENVTLNFSTVNVTYKEQLETGGAGASPTMGWDIAANTHAS
ncbi:MAG TPA: type VI secretion system tube protein Hcp [Caulobacteraceae bacterium]